MQKTLSHDFFTSSLSSVMRIPKIALYLKDKHLNFVNDPPYRDQGQTTDPSGEFIKIQHTNIFGNKNIK